MTWSLGAFLCLAIAVHDADGPIRCASGQKVRLAGIAAREWDGSCQPNQPCPPGSPLQARRALIRAMGAVEEQGTAEAFHARFSRPVRLTCTATSKSHGRVVAWCRLPNGRDLSCEAIRVRAAVRWARFDPAGRLARC
jgi:endonuclease YncB( thermonuclease family)